MNIHLNFDFNLHSFPEWVEDKGTGVINMENFDIVVKMQITEQNGKMHFSIVDLWLDIPDYEINFLGDGDFSAAISEALNIYKQLFRTQISNILAKRMATAFAKIGNIFLQNGVNLLKIPYSDVFFNFSLLSDPYIHDDFIAFPLEGSFAPLEKDPSRVDLIGVKAWGMMPAFVKNDRHLQYMVHENSINSLLYALYSEESLIY